MLCPSCGYDNIEGSDRCEECLTPLSKLDVPQADATQGWARSVMEANLHLLELEETVTVSPQSSALEAAQKMKAAKCGCVLVLEDGRLVGIFTEHDVLHRMFGGGTVAEDVPVKELMSPNPESLRETDSVATALNKMSLGRYRHIPVTKADGTYSVTSINGVLKYIAKEDW
jgi:CBS domain-containing protein